MGCADVVLNDISGGIHSCHVPGAGVFFTFFVDKAEGLPLNEGVKAIFSWGIGVLVCATCGVVWFMHTAPGEKKVRFVTTMPTRGDFVSKVQATGTLEPQELVDVGAQVTGEIKEFGTDTEGRRVDYGSEVKAGQLLARIDDTIVELDIKRAEASVAQAKAQIQSAKAGISQAKANKNKAVRDMERAKLLGVGDALSQSDYDQFVTAVETTSAAEESATAQLATAEAQLQSAEAALASQLRNRDYTRITTPVDGTIVVRQVNVGQTVVSSMNATTLFLVARDLSHMQIWTSVNEADIAKVHPGQEVRYTVDALPNETFTGTVNKIRPNATMSSNVVTYIVEVDIENPERKLLPYMSANANFIVDEVKDCLMVEDTAFAFRPEPAYIDPSAPRPGSPDMREEAPAGERPEWVWKKRGEYVVPVPVKRGLTDGTRSVVSPLHEGELTENDEIVTGVRVMKAEDTPAASGGDEKNPFGMQRPKRRERSAGGVEAKSGQSAKNDHPSPPPM